MAKGTVVSDEYFGVIVRPLLTERSTIAKERNNQYAFEVERHADKGIIKRAVQALFKVDVLAVRTMVVPGKYRRYGKGGGLRPDWKKALVTIGKGQKIEVAEQTA
ncbi:MAG TPA: 50S ribosomal protein L23 [Elusimicrobia bacterium]|nr:50S ribosomal protein L23 [Elusimicrobiota bacterium]HBT62413.1 50S ribosomal protein L23 [Elusimicrobiota bacterium]